MKKTLQPYIPEILPPELSSDDVIELLHLETKAISKISQFNTMLERSVVEKNLMSIFRLNESIESTKIEGTQATLSDVMESDITGKKTYDIIEVLNYSKALEQGKELLKTLPISTRLFHELHKIILRKARGANRSPGEYRTTQNFIGPTTNIEDATYIPPPANEISRLMSNLENYINENDSIKLGILSKAAVIHGQFETIHPYYDGNGRLGRILIVLFLMSNGAIKDTNFFLSIELERNKHQYYALLNHLRTDTPKWKDWIRFFIIAAERQADTAIDRLLRVEALYKKAIKIADENGIRTDVVKTIFNSPIFNVRLMENLNNVSYETARKHVNLLEKSGLVFGNDKARNKMYYFYELLDILR